MHCYIPNFRIAYLNRGKLPTASSIKGHHGKNETARSDSKQLLLQTIEERRTRSGAR